MREAIVFCFFLFFFGNGFAQLEVNILDDKALFMEGRDSVLVFQTEPKSLNGSFERANYIHPLYSLDGVAITEDFPKDHLHHRGIFWAWHQLYLNDTEYGDGWEIRDFEWEVVSTSEIKENSMALTLKSEVIWKSATAINDTDETRPLVKETNWITVYPKASNYRAIDIKIQLYPLFDTILIGGSENEKGYGGFSARVQLSEDVKFKDSKGTVIPENTPVAGKDWINILSRTKESNTKYGLVIIPSEKNPGYPSPWILRENNSMQNAVYPHPGATSIPLSNVKPTILRYRLIIHNGNLDDSVISKLQHQYFEQTQQD
ncbi:DUF6807 family protein [Maribacter cobaltidurans]|uniref:Uncharacterized protein n=1 Tax=Maribacter cobaltidurans TaxID=1178778 RepID=A0A223V1J8_9FLAO|nr:DUF6807 family protein [Maribacter cobaltidurans]ASV29263.1 hypothetical protein CJ263_02945 [Maribacter cobaltidurans]GGD70538.1 hypothetical protein GCM10011412_05180 [Maribacter cobaltidurans]